ncbi:MAG: segregation/condensation protein A [Hallerella succinigenes]|uniref:segregation and condensation protein A n=1 Tax=Hallerella succinigenes TaxID=1896222 RepID=UPI0023F3DA6C|nr:segregation/condensation protein A [Hallerella succinigenes]MDD6090947.1 segregation/condensation protein A [Hallerella succinigenes]
MNYEAPESYEVHIGAFEGPMDLLLYLVQQSEVKPADISIAEITDQYLEWMKDISQADLSQAGDFLLMASRLMAMKVRELLPKDQRTEQDEAEIDLSRDELIQQMLEYQRYKQVAKELQGMENENFGSCYRGRMEKTESEEDTLADANIWQLFRAYQKMLKTRNSENVHHIELDDVTIEDRQQFISNTLHREGRVLFEDLLGRDPLPIVTVVTFMALMEMIKTDEVVFRQSELFGAIWLYRKKDNAEFAEEMANETRIYEPEHEYKPGILEKLRERELVRNDNQQATLDQVMRTASLLASHGKAIKDDDIMAMLNGELDVAAVEAELNAGQSDSESSEPSETLETSSQAGEASETANASVEEEKIEIRAEDEALDEATAQVEEAEIAASLAENTEPPIPEELLQETEPDDADSAEENL